jgi:hypothetical protein
VGLQQRATVLAPCKLHIFISFVWNKMVLPISDVPSSICLFGTDLEMLPTLFSLFFFKVYQTFSQKIASSDKLQRG